ncbi:MAG: hypothetical protein LBB40_03550, partial [Holophagales bacterium]|nr:hypothetical protein [Holophagales bacterium]
MKSDDKKLSSLARENKAQRTGNRSEIVVYSETTLKRYVALWFSSALPFRSPPVGGLLHYSAALALRASHLDKKDDFKVDWLHWLKTLDKFTGDFGFGVLESAGMVNHIEAVEKAHREYDVYIAQIPDDLTDVEKAYLDILRDMQKK